MDVFLSYASVDRERVRPIVEAIERRGLSVWWDRDIPPGMTWPDVIKAALGDTRAMVVVWTAASVESRWVQIEAMKGDESGRLLPIALDPVEPPLQFSLIQAADLTAWDGRGEDPQLMAVLSQLDAWLGSDETDAEARPLPATSLGHGVRAGSGASEADPVHVTETDVVAPRDVPTWGEMLTTIGMGAGLLALPPIGLLLWSTGTLAPRILAVPVLAAGVYCLVALPIRLWRTT